MDIFGIVLLVVGIFIGVFSKFIVFKSLEKQMKNINLQYNDFDNAEEEVKEDYKIDDDFLPILKIVKLITYLLSATIIIFGFLIILIFRIYS